MRDADEHRLSCDEAALNVGSVADGMKNRSGRGRDDRSRDDENIDAVLAATCAESACLMQISVEVGKCSYAVLMEECLV